MALIKCPDCKKKISDQSVNCLHCGCPVQSYIQQQDLNADSSEAEQMKRANKKVGWIVGIAVLVAVLLTITAILLALGVFAPPFSENTAAIEAADASVVKVFCYDHEGELAATGSGFIVYDSRTVVTNYHVVTSAYKCKISTNLDVSYDVADVLCYSEELDLVFLRLVKDTELQPLTFGSSAELKKGEAVVAIGSPLGIKNTVSTGVLSGRPTQNNMEVLQFTAPISHGSSGGALFDDTGNVIGITFAGIEDGQNLNFAIPAEKAVELYDARPQRSMNLFEIYKKEHPYAIHLGFHPNVTLTDLKTNPEKYDEKKVMLTTYVSSLKLDPNGEWEHSNLLVSSKNDVSFDYEYDWNLVWNSDKDFQDIPYMDCWLGISSNPDAILSISEGDKVVLIGELNYNVIGEETGAGDYIDKQNIGFFRITHIYKYS